MITPGECWLFLLPLRSIIYQLLLSSFRFGADQHHSLFSFLVAYFIYLNLNRNAIEERAWKMMCQNQNENKRLQARRKLNFLNWFKRSYFTGTAEIDPRLILSFFILINTYLAQHADSINASYEFLDFVFHSTLLDDVYYSLLILSAGSFRTC